MPLILRRLGALLLQSELAEREAHARKLATEAYQGAKQPGKRGRVWWDGYANAIRAVREERHQL